MSKPRNTINSIADQLRKSKRRIVYISKVRRKQKNKGMFLVRSANLKGISSLSPFPFP